MVGSHNPIMLHFKVTYLELYEFSNALQIKLYGRMLSRMNLPPEVRRMASNAKFYAQNTKDRVAELRRLYSYTYVYGYPANGGSYSKFLKYEQVGRTLMNGTAAEEYLFGKHATNIIGGKGE